MTRLSGIETPLFEIVPDWVEVLPDPALPVDMDKIAYGGSIALCSDSQISLHGPVHRYRRHVVHVVNPSGLERAASLQVTFDPAFQRLILHTIEVLRDGAQIDAREAAKIETIRREPRLEAQMIDGNLTTTVQLNDVRVGDTVAFAFSIIGEHPIFRGFFWDALPMEWSHPIVELRRKVTAPGGTRLTIRPSHPEIAHQHVRTDAGEEWRWHLKDTLAAHQESDVPCWFNPFRVVELSTFKDWHEVAQIVAPLYDTGQAIPAELQAEVERIAATSPEIPERVMAALAVIDRNVRYLAVSIGEGGVRPRSIDDIWKTRFGDCKDMSLLLTTMLRRLGIEACPALVSAGTRRGAANRLPMPSVFDHCIVRIATPKLYWIDPTRAGRPTTLDTLFQQDFGVALPLSAESAGLETLSIADPCVVTIACEQRLDLSDGVGEPARLTVKRTFRSFVAEHLRATMQRVPRAQIESGQKKAVESAWHDVEVANEIAITDDPAANVLTFEEKYLLKNPWKTIQEAPMKRQLQVGMLDLFKFQSLPQARARKYPLYVIWPARTTERLEILTPEKWQVSEGNRTFDTPALKFTSSVAYDGHRTIILEGTTTAKRDAVDPENVAEFFDALKGVDASLSLTLTKTEANSAGTENDSIGSRWAFWWIGIVIFSMLSGILRNGFHPSGPRPFQSPYPKQLLEPRSPTR